MSTCCYEVVQRREPIPHAGAEKCHGVNSGQVHVPCYHPPHHPRLLGLLGRKVQVLTHHRFAGQNYTRVTRQKIFCETHYGASNWKKFWRGGVFAGPHSAIMESCSLHMASSAIRMWAGFTGDRGVLLETDYGRPKNYGGLACQYLQCKRSEGNQMGSRWRTWPVMRAETIMTTSSGHGTLSHMTHQRLTMSVT